MEATMAVTIKPSFHHITLKTSRLPQMVDWYKTLVFEKPVPIACEPQKSCANAKHAPIFKLPALINSRTFHILLGR
jgi:hypothetical protein